MKPITLTAPGLVLRPPGPDDLGAVTAACQDPEIQRWIPLPVPYAEADAADFVLGASETGWQAGTTCTWAIEREGRFAGVVSLDAVRDGSASIGYWVAAHARGRGTMTTAAGAVLQLAFDAAGSGLGLRRVEWRAAVGNAASAAVAQHLGFRYEGTARSSGVLRERRTDEWVAGLLDTDARRRLRWPGFG